MTDNTTGKTEEISESKNSQPITAVDLYGPSESDSQPLAYEETPIIEPITGDPTGTHEKQELPKADDTKTADSNDTNKEQVTYTIPPQPGQIALPVKKSDNRGSIVNIIVIVVLFGLGMGTSFVLRNRLPDIEYPDLKFSGLPFPQKPEVTSTPRIEVTPSPQPQISLEVTSSPTSNTDWSKYSIISGTTKKSLAGISFRLPDTVKPPVCDTQSCASQGTQLPGGTRFTVAARGTGQLLADPRGKLLTDATGKEFTMKETTVAGYKTTEFTANFIGSTGGGYAFTKMRGLMVAVSDKTVVELNHFAPSGKSTDFASDDELFDKIVQTLAYENDFTATPFPKPTTP